LGDLRIAKLLEEEMKRIFLINEFKFTSGNDKNG